ncbi:sarcospan [Bacillus rossius redtenbacheri]|uniref:sarcospan n=1 Tax=Bacillus rossius redtenbacheri TaxID=93214 RepID=UPI002FDCFF36
MSHTLPRAGKPAAEAGASRPASLYDNLQRSASGGLAGGGGGGDCAAGHSQAVYLATTVPQNMAAIDIAGRHAPTRNSLRHSRMIVLRQVSRKYQPPVMRRHKLATGLVALQALMGVAVATLALWLLLWAPHLRIRDIPYWSGVPLILSGVFGLLLLCCCRKEYPGMPLGFFVYGMKVFSVFLSVVAGCACFCACVFSLLHLVFLSQMDCRPPPRSLSNACVCSAGSEAAVEPERVYHYTDLNCGDLGVLSVLLVGSCAANGIGGILAMWYVFLHWSSRYAFLYAEVRADADSPGVISNKAPRK